MVKRILDKLNIIFNAIEIRFVALSKGAWISLGATVYIHRGACLEIGRGARVAKGCVLSVLPNAMLELKEGCIINQGTIIYVANRVEIGSNTRIAQYCSILDHDYNIYQVEQRFEAEKISTPIEIAANVWLGAYVLILKGVTIGEYSVIGAQTMVRKPVPERTLVYCQSNSQMTMKPL